MASHPDAHGEIKRVFADADYVILHSHWHGLSDDPRGEAVVDIYRSEKGKVVEHWDVVQPIPETAANNNTMFGSPDDNPWRRYSRALLLAAGSARSDHIPIDP